MHHTHVQDYMLKNKHALFIITTAVWREANLVHKVVKFGQLRQQH